MVYLGMTWVAGIDYSLTSPAICIAEVRENKIKFEDCRFHYIKQKKNQNSVGVFNGYDYPKYSDEMERYENLAEWVIERIRWYNGRVKCVYLEDYAFAATGRVFNIAENTGILKHRLKKNNFKFKTIPPTVIKKHASGKGNANKELMYETFLKETKIDLQSQLTPKSTKIINPVSDIIDSYYIAKCGIEEVYDR
jgi:Holliday junction resolvasome RuvABC endonuclease subunit